MSSWENTPGMTLRGSSEHQDECPGLCIYWEMTLISTAWRFLIAVALNRLVGSGLRVQSGEGIPS
jgi:hypothetical protein